MRRDHLVGIISLGAAALSVGGAADAQAPPEPKVQAEAFLSQMDASRHTARSAAAAAQLQTARAERDVVRALCLNDKLNQIDVAVRSARERQQQIERGALRGDDDLTRHELTILTVLRERTVQLTAEARQCVGNPPRIDEDTAVTPETDDDLPAEDPSEYPSTDVIVEPPACSSCFK
jgi:hypothetical protein